MKTMYYINVTLAAIDGLMFILTQSPYFIVLGAVAIFAADFYYRQMEVKQDE